jgi:hypothetical protein
MFLYEKYEFENFAEFGIFFLGIGYFITYDDRTLVLDHKGV